MEQRDRKARHDSLSELRRLRTEGGNRMETLPRTEPSSHAASQSSDEEFIEHVPKRPFFKRTEPRLDPTLLQDDDYFQSLLSQMDAEVELGADLEVVGSGASLDTELLPVKQEMENILSSEFAPKDGLFEMDDRLLNEQLQMVNWSDLEDEMQTSQLVGVDSKNDMHMDRSNDSQLDNQMQANSSKSSQTLAIESIVVEESIPTANIPVNIANGEKVNFYFMDAFEKPNGTIFLFGKISQGNSFASCCVTVTNMKRNLFFLPRECLLGTEDEVTLKDVHEEISAIAAKYRIGRFGCKKVMRRYAFEMANIPVEADYIKMVYPFAEGPMLPKDLSGNSFSHVFGTATSALELLLVKRKIMGPGWLSFTPKSVSKRNVSWCKVEMEVDDPKSITPLANGPETPTMTILSLSIRTVVHEESKTHEIVAASGLVYNAVQVDGNAGSEKPKCNAVFSVARETENLGFTQKFMEQTVKQYGGRVELAKNERTLLGYLIAMIHRSDPDIIVGHNFLGFDLGVLLHRMRACKVDFWSRLGRLNWSQWPKAKPGSTEASYAERQVVSGRLICDTYLCAKDLVRCKNYSLQTLVETQLQQERVAMDYDRVREFFATPDQLVFLLRHCERDAFFQASLMFQLMVLPLTKQLTNIAGNLWSRTMVGARAERNEFLLLHEFHSQKYICPDKGHQYEVSTREDQEETEVIPTAKGKRKPTYAGGLVLEPKKGLYDNIVLLLDFNSLYPSIIQEYNICFTTIERDYSTGEDVMPTPPEPGTPLGLLPKILANLVARRRQIKTLMKDPKLASGAYAQLHIRQQALKLTANSMYGCLGFAHSRFFAKPLAMLITGKGREILQNTVDLAQSQCRLEVVYGDTDSVMIHTGTRNLSEARRMGQLLKKTVNEKYRLLEIEIDGVFEKLLLLKKKKYAAVIMEERADGSVKRRIETKGLDLVRRDWCPLSVDTSNQVLQRILSENSETVEGLPPNTHSTGESVQRIAPTNEEVVEGIHHILNTVASQVTLNQIPLEQYIISKEPEQYHDSKTQPHVVVALRMKERGIAVRAGDTIPYIICGSARKEGALADHAFHPDDVRKDHLQVDTDWYLAQQVHPCVARLCEHLDGTDAGRLAACLGLDAAKYHSRTTPAAEDETVRLTAFLTDEEKFRNVEHLSLVCLACRGSFEFRSLLVSSPEGQVVSGLDCACGQRISPVTFHCQLLAVLARHIAEYYLGWMDCDEPACRSATRQPCVYETRCPVDTCRGAMRPRYPAGRLYSQLLYYRSLLEGKPTAEWKAMIAEHEPLRLELQRRLERCAYPIISLGDIFSFVKL